MMAEDIADEDGIVDHEDADGHWEHP
jgi:hypothetical protein